MGEKGDEVLMKRKRKRRGKKIKKMKKKRNIGKGNSWCRREESEEGRRGR